MENYDDLLSDNCSNEEAYYSDRIDSDIEAELYGLIHHDAQDNSVSVENISVPHQDKSDSAEKDSVSLQNKLGSNSDNSVVLQVNSVLPESNLNSTKKLKKSAKKKKKKSTDYVKINKADLFCSDVIVSTNLYTSFESPDKKLKTQNSPMRSENSKRNISKTPTRQKFDLLSENENSTRNPNKKPTKRKSDLVSELLDTIQAKKNKNSESVQSGNYASEQKKNNCAHSVTEADSFVVVDDSSDSESDSSIIFLEPNQSDLKTNLTEEAVVLSSDSEASDSSMEKHFSDICQKKPTQISDAVISSNKDIWHINSEDLFRTRKQSNRYHENASINCSNCQLRGHSAKFCTVPKALKCFFCGDRHPGTTCKNKICTKCFQLGHDRRYCYIHYVDTCELCRMRGHSEKNCPDLWRRYHLTTSKGNIVKGNPNPHSPLYCYNCGSKGHYGAECMEFRTNRWNFPTWTSVISYRNPASVLQKEGNRSSSSNKPWFLKKRGNEVFSNNTPTPNTKKKKKKKSPKTLPNANPQPTTVVNVQNNYYFPRTPKRSPIPTLSSTPGTSRKRCKKLKNKEDRIIRQRELHRIGLHQRLGLPFPSTV